MRRRKRRRKKRRKKRKRRRRRGTYPLAGEAYPGFLGLPTHLTCGGGNIGMERLSCERGEMFTRGERRDSKEHLDREGEREGVQILGAI